MRGRLALPVLLGLVTARQHEFSVHNDLLAYPQYDIVYAESYVPETEAEQLLASSKDRLLQSTEQSQNDPSISPSSDRHDLQKPLKYDSHGSQTPSGSGQDPGSSSQHPTEYFERLVLHSRPYLCTIPHVQLPSSADRSDPTESAEAEAQAAELQKQKQRELTRATNHGWELLKGMQGHCMYYSAGWWVYSFCYNKPDGIKQFHPLPPGKNVPIYPPVEDTDVQSYILGRFENEIDSGSGSSFKESEQDEDESTDLDQGKVGKADDQAEDKSSGDKEDAKGATNALSSKRKKKKPSTQLATQNSQTYLVRHLSGGTTCDLTGRPRRISVQFHCNPHAVDHISMIKETTSCVYLMVIQTPLLCNDIAFHPPTDEIPNTISCREIIDDSHPPAIKAWKARKQAQADAILKGASPLGQHRNSPPGAGFGGGDQDNTADELDSEAEEAAADPSADQSKRTVIGGVVLGAQKLVGGAADRTIKASGILAKLESGGAPDRKQKVVATLAKSDGKHTSIMTEREMKNSGLTEKGVSREEVEKWVKKVEHGHGAQGTPWQIDLVRTAKGLEPQATIGRSDEEGAGDDAGDGDGADAKTGRAKRAGKEESSEGRKAGKDSDRGGGGNVGSDEEYK